MPRRPTGVGRLIVEDNIVNMRRFRIWATKIAELIPGTRAYHQRELKIVDQGVAWLRDHVQRQLWEAANQQQQEVILRCLFGEGSPLVAVVLRSDRTLCPWLADPVEPSIDAWVDQVDDPVRRRRQPLDPAPDASTAYGPRGTS